MTKKQEQTVESAYSSYCRECKRLNKSINSHEGVATFMIAKALMKKNKRLTYLAAVQIALEFLARQPFYMESV